MIKSPKSEIWNLKSGIKNVQQEKKLMPFLDLGDLLQKIIL